MTDFCMVSLKMSDGMEWMAHTGTGDVPQVQVRHQHDQLNIALLQRFKNSGEMRMLGAWLIANADIQDKLEQEMYRRSNGQG